MRRVHDRPSFVLSTFRNYKDMPYMHFHELSFTPSDKPQKSKYSAKFPLKTIKRKITSTAHELISLCYNHSFIDLFTDRGK